MHPETGERVWPPIITQRDHADLIELFSDPNRLRSRRGQRYILTGLVVCAKCGRTLNGNPQRQRRRYICRSTGEMHMVIDADQLEGLVFNEAAERPDPPLREVANPSGDLVEKIDALDRKIAEWTREGAAAGLSPHDVASATAQLRADRKVLEAELASVPPSMTWEDAYDPMRQREWLEALIESITIRPANGPRTPVADRAEIVWR